MTEHFSTRSTVVPSIQKRERCPAVEACLCHESKGRVSILIANWMRDRALLQATSKEFRNLTGASSSGTQSTIASFSDSNDLKFGWDDSGWVSNRHSNVMFGGTSLNTGFSINMAT
jgi:hypothetical protein